MKTTGSAFEGFYRDEYTTLVPVNDRIFSTSVDLLYTFKDISIAAPKDEKRLEFEIPLKKGDEGYEGSVWDEEVPVRARKATLEVFSMDESASVQVSVDFYGCSVPLSWWLWCGHWPRRFAGARLTRYRVVAGLYLIGPGPWTSLAMIIPCILKTFGVMVWLLSDGIALSLTLG